MSDEKRVYIPGPDEIGGAFEVRDDLTIYQAAMVYSGRHPGGNFVDGAGGYPRAALGDFELYLGRGADDGPRKLAWDVYCQLREAVASGRIVPKRRAYNSFGEIDPRDTVISIEDVARLARERGESPQYLTKWPLAELVLCESAKSGSETKGEQPKRLAKKRRFAPATAKALGRLKQQWPNGDIPSRESMSDGEMHRALLPGALAKEFSLDILRAVRKNLAGKPDNSR